MSSITFRIIRRIGNRFGLRIQKKSEIECLTVPMFLRDTFKEKSAVKVLQIGANDGMSEGDPIAPFYDDPKFSGLLLEPQPVAYKRLQKNLINKPQWKTLNVAVSSHRGEISFYVVGHPMRSKHPLFTDRISSCLRDEVVKKLVMWGHSQEEAEMLVEEVKVPSKKFSDIIMDLDDKPDCVAIDTEGLDWLLVKMMFESSLRPQLLIFERSRLSPKEKKEIPDVLLAHGYAWYPCGGDIVAKVL
jgi:FkbM family methyltransferase